MNISNFMSWWISEFVRIGTFGIGKLDEILLYSQVSLLDLIITIAIIGIFISIVLTLPQIANKTSTRIERKQRSKKK